MRFIRRRRGSGLIEILVALAILGLLVTGVLQMFSVALVQNYGSSSRTQLTYKCQQVVEILRLSQFLGNQGQTAFAASYAIPYPLVADSKTSIPLPYLATGGMSAGWSAWGPSGANVIEREWDAYRIYFVVEDGGTVGLRVRVTAMPVNSPDLPVALKPGTPPKGTSVRNFLGGLSKMKRVDYVAHIPR